MANGDRGTAALRFGGFTLDLARGLLLDANGGEVPLRAKSLDLLRVLAFGAGRTLSKDELLDAVWPGVHVTEDSLFQCVRDVRRALGDPEGRVLRTIQRRGYLLDAAVERVGASLPALPAPPGGGPPALVVLPLECIGGGAGEAAFAEGLSEEMGTVLSRSRWFSLIARNSAFAAARRTADPRRIGLDLGARYVLRGSVRRGAGRLRIACALADTAIGLQLWADRFEGGAGDIFDLQDKIAEAVAGAVEPELREAEVARARAKPTENLDAYDLTLRALPQIHAPTREGGAETLNLLRRAAALDPGYALPRALAASCQSQRVLQGWAAPSDREEGIRFAQEAVAAGRDDPAALHFAARGLLVLGPDHAAAAAAAARSLALSPHSAEVLGTAGFVAAVLGRWEEAIPHLERAASLSPLDPELGYHFNWLSISHLATGRHEAALDWGRRALAEMPAWMGGHRQVIAALALLGRLGEAESAARRFREVLPGAARLSAERDRRMFLDLRFVEARLAALRAAGLPD